MLAFAITPPARGQLAAKFDEISIAPHQRPEHQLTFRVGGPDLAVRGNRFVRNGYTVAWLLMDAYSVQELQIAGLPAWAQGPECAYFDISAAARQEPSLEQLRAMLQAMLADRFHLQVHREVREMPVYALEIDPAGLKMRSLPAGSPSNSAASSWEKLLGHLTRSVDRPVLDRTGLAGQYEYETPQFSHHRGGPPPESIFDAVRTKLGLRLMPRTDRIEMLVVDRVASPWEN